MNDAERLAAEAQRLLAEPLLLSALDSLMAEAFAEFKAMKVTPETIYEVIALQQRINVIQAIPGTIEASIYASGQKDGGIVVEKKPTA